MGGKQKALQAEVLYMTWYTHPCSPGHGGHNTPLSVRMSQMPSWHLAHRNRYDVNGGGPGSSPHLKVLHDGGVFRRLPVSGCASPLASYGSDLNVSASCPAFFMWELTGLVTFVMSAARVWAANDSRCGRCYSMQPASYRFLSQCIVYGESYLAICS